MKTFIPGEKLVVLEERHALYGKPVVYMGVLTHRSTNLPDGDWRIIRFDPAGEIYEDPTEYMRVQHLMNWEEYLLSESLKGMS